MKLVQKETLRQDVEHHLGSPISTSKLANGHTIATYDVQSKTDPSLLRAAGHGTLDLFTLGLWEVVGGPAEVYMGRRVNAWLFRSSKLNGCG
jgi:hypothetical protein